jgi:hypothetical protein
MLILILFITYLHFHNSKGANVDIHFFVPVANDKSTESSSKQHSNNSTSIHTTEFFSAPFGNSHFYNNDASWNKFASKTATKILQFLDYGFGLGFVLQFIGKQRREFARKKDHKNAAHFGKVSHYRMILTPIIVGEGSQYTPYAELTHEQAMSLTKEPNSCVDTNCGNIKYWLSDYSAKQSDNLKLVRLSNMDCCLTKEGSNTELWVCKPESDTPDDVFLASAYRESAIEVLHRQAEPLFKEILKSSQLTDDVKGKIGELFWYLVDSPLFVRGSSACAQILICALFRWFSCEPIKYHSSNMMDLDAITVTKEKFREFFIKRIELCHLKKPELGKKVISDTGKESKIIKLLTGLFADKSKVVQLIESNKKRLIDILECLGIFYGRICEDDCTQDEAVNIFKIFFISVDDISSQNGDIFKKCLHEEGGAQAIVDTYLAVNDKKRAQIIKYFYDNLRNFDKKDLSLFNTILRDLNAVHDVSFIDSILKQLFGADKLSEQLQRSDFLAKGAIISLFIFGALEVEQIKQLNIANPKNVEITLFMLMCLDPETNENLSSAQKKQLECFAIIGLDSGYNDAPKYLKTQLKWFLAENPNYDVTVIIDKIPFLKTLFAKMNLDGAAKQLLLKLFFNEVLTKDQLGQISTANNSEKIIKVINYFAKALSNPKQVAHIITYIEFIDISELKNATEDQDHFLRYFYSALYKSKQFAALDTVTCSGKADYWFLANAILAKGSKDICQFYKDYITYLSQNNRTEDIVSAFIKLVAAEVSLLRANYAALHDFAKTSFSSAILLEMPSEISVKITTYVMDNGNVDPMLYVWNLLVQITMGSDMDADGIKFVAENFVNMDLQHQKKFLRLIRTISDDEEDPLRILRAIAKELSIMSVNSSSSATCKSASFFGNAGALPSNPISDGKSPSERFQEIMKEFNINLTIEHMSFSLGTQTETWD